MAENTLKEIEAAGLTKKYHGAVSFVLVKSFNELIQSEVVANFFGRCFQCVCWSSHSQPNIIGFDSNKKED